MNNQTHPGTAVVTGVTGGVGPAYALGLAERGYDLLLVGRTQASVQTLADDIAGATGRQVDIAVHDLSETGQIRELGDRLATSGDVSLLANLATDVTFSPFAEISSADIDQGIAVNISALTHLSRAVAPGFVQRGRGVIVNFSSVLAFHPWAELNVYNAAKAYVVILSQSMQAELRDKGVLVQVVAPAATATGFWERAGFSHTNFPREAVMQVGNLVQAALTGLDRREEWVLPSLSDAAVWDTYQAAREKLVAGMMTGTPAGRYAGA
jgi:hypothetical protein